MIFFIKQLMLHISYATDILTEIIDESDTDFDKINVEVAYLLTSFLII